MFRDWISLRVNDDDILHEQMDPKSSRTEHDFKLYVMDLSYFSGKLEMYFRYKELKYQRLEPTCKQLADIVARETGCEQAPQVFDQRTHVPDNQRWLRDTTYIIEHLENDTDISKDNLSIMPACPVQLFFHRLLEDYADEYLWRPAMWWRWVKRSSYF